MSIIQLLIVFKIRELEKYDEFVNIYQSRLDVFF